VDDDATQRARSRRALSKVGADVSEAENGEVALSALRLSAPYDLVLMDINMPVMDGYTTAEKIRADHQDPNWNVLIAAYTAEPANVTRVLARRAGMDDMISKSASAVELITALQTLFESGNRHVHSHPTTGLPAKRFWWRTTTPTAGGLPKVIWSDAAHASSRPSMGRTCWRGWRRRAPSMPS
jgi:two-component system CAI-1 autoinducer sensor kinase/phosphatase CqsS